VVVAAESAVERAGLVALLAGSPAVAIVHASDNVRDLEAIAAAHEADVLVLALRSPNEIPLPLDLTADMAHRAPALVVLIDETSAAWTREALASGVYAVLPRDVTSEELHAAVQAAGARLLALTREQYAAIGVTTPVRSGRPADSRVAEPLTRREAEILGMLADGLANKEIAARLQISAHTVKTHVQSLFAKLGADSRAEAVAVGVRRGLILL
jgi:DNA-binding NarL/FixJ family response regulator